MDPSKRVPCSLCSTLPRCFLLLVEPDNSTCRASMTRVKDKAHQLGIMMELSKEKGPTTTITFLGIELDSEALVARLPPEKLRDLMNELPQWLSRRKATKHNLDRCFDN